MVPFSPASQKPEIPSLAADDGPIFLTVAKLVGALQRALAPARDLELKNEVLQRGRDLLCGTKYEEER
jgi:hypothetical protein